MFGSFEELSQFGYFCYMGHILLQLLFHSFLDIKKAPDDYCCPELFINKA